MSNEKRAHDLAIASIPIIYDEFVNKAKKQVAINGDAEKLYTFDIYAEYLKAYNSLLKIFNRDFPQED